MKKYFENRALITNLFSKCNWQELKDIFSPCGGVIFVTAHKVPNTGTVQFKDKYSLNKAFKNYDGMVIRDRPIKMILEKDRRNLSSNQQEKTLTWHNRDRSSKHVSHSRRESSSSVKNMRSSLDGKMNTTRDGRIKWATAKTQTSKLKSIYEKNMTKVTSPSNDEASYDSDEYDSPHRQVLTIVENLRSEKAEESSEDESCSNHARIYINDGDDEAIGYKLKNDQDESMDSDSESENDEYSTNVSNHSNDDTNEAIKPQELQLNKPYEVSSSPNHISDNVENIDDTQEGYSGRDNFYLEKVLSFPIYVIEQWSLRCF